MCSILNAVDKTIIGSIEPLTDWGIVGMPQSVLGPSGALGPTGRFTLGEPEGTVMEGGERTRRKGKGVKLV